MQQCCENKTIFATLLQIYKMLRYFLLTSCALFVINLQAQIFTGRLVDEKSAMPVIGASVYYVEYEYGVLSDTNGYFKFDKIGSPGGNIIDYGLLVMIVWSIKRISLKPIMK